MAKIYRKRGNKLNEVVTFDSACTRQENQPLVYDATDGSVHTTTHIGCLDADDVSVGNLTVTGQAIIQEQVTDTIGSNTLVLRSNADGGLTGTENSGLIIHNYNGSEDLYAVTDNTGTFRVGTAVSTTTTYPYLRYNEVENKWYSTAPEVTPAVEVTPVGSPTSWDSVVTSGDNVEYTNIVFSVIDRTSLEPLTTRDESTDMEANYLTKWNSTDEKVVTTGTSCTHDLCTNGNITVTCNACINNNITVDCNACIGGTETVTGEIHSCTCVTAPTACISDDLYVSGDINNCCADSVIHGYHGCFDGNVTIAGSLTADTLIIPSITSDCVKTVENTANCTFYPSFVQNNHVVAGANELYTDGSLTYNPASNTLCTDTYISDRGIVQSAISGVTAADLGLTANTSYSLSTIVSCLQACCGNKAVSYTFKYENASNPNVLEYGGAAYNLIFEKLDNNDLSGTWSKSRWLVTGENGVSWTVVGNTTSTAGSITWTVCEHVVDQICVASVNNNQNFPIIFSTCQSTPSSFFKKTLYNDSANNLMYNPSTNTLTTDYLCAKKDLLADANAIVCCTVCAGDITPIVCSISYTPTSTNEVYFYLGKVRGGDNKGTRLTYSLNGTGIVDSGEITIINASNTNPFVEWHQSCSYISSVGVQALVVTRDGEQWNCSSCYYLKIIPWRANCVFNTCVGFVTKSMDTADMGFRSLSGTTYLDICGCNEVNWSSVPTCCSQKVSTVCTTNNANYYLTFVDSNNSTTSSECIYTNSGLYYNPLTNTLTTGTICATSFCNSCYITLQSADPSIYFKLNCYTCGPYTSTVYQVTQGRMSIAVNNGTGTTAATQWAYFGFYSNGTFCTPSLCVNNTTSNTSSLFTIQGNTSTDLSFGPTLKFSNTNATQNACFIYTDFDSYLSGASVTLASDQNAIWLCSQYGKFNATVTCNLRLYHPAANTDWKSLACISFGTEYTGGATHCPFLQAACLDNANMNIAFGQGGHTIIYAGEGVSGNFSDFITKNGADEKVVLVSDGNAADIVVNANQGITYSSKWVFTNNGINYCVYGTSAFECRGRILIGVNQNIFIGSNSTGTTNVGAIVIGHNCITTAGSDSIALGCDAIIACSSSIAIGSKPTTCGRYATAIGYCAGALADNAIAIGDYAKVCTNKTEAMAIGCGSTANGVNSISIGCGSTTNAIDSIAIGCAALTNCAGSIAIGVSSCTCGSYSVAIGMKSVAANYSIAIGCCACSDSPYGTAIGYDAWSAYRGFLAIGMNSKAAACKNVSNNSFDFPFSSTIEMDDEKYGRHGRIKFVIPSCSQNRDITNFLNCLFVYVINSGRCSCTWSASSCCYVPTLVAHLSGFYWDDGGSSNRYQRWAPGINGRGNINELILLNTSSGAGSNLSVCDLIVNCGKNVCTTSWNWGTGTNIWTCGMVGTIEF